MNDKTIIICGMHRSGSSLVARIFHEWGVNLGSNLMEGDFANPEGFFENWDFVNLNNDLLSENGGSWNEPVVVTKPDKRCKELIEKHKTFLWGWKDNRTAFTFFAYEPYLNKKDILFVITKRRKESVIKSLMNTHSEQFKEELRNKAYFSELYDYYYRAIDLITRGYNRIDIHYEDLISNPFYNQKLKHF